MSILLLLKNTKDRIRIIGLNYLKNNKIRIWNGKRLNCEHNREQNTCKDNKRRSICKDCGGVSICEYNKI